jgi:hypothetical protein
MNPQNQAKSTRFDICLSYALVDKSHCSVSKTFDLAIVIEMHDCRQWAITRGIRFFSRAFAN